MNQNNNSLNNNSNNNLNQSLYQNIPDQNGYSQVNYNQNNMNVSSQQNYNMSQQPVGGQQPKKNNKAVIILVIVLVILLIFSLIFILNKMINNNLDDNNVNTDNSSLNVNDINQNGFLLNIDDTYTITGRGTVVTGEIKIGKVNKGDTVDIIGYDGASISAEVTDIVVLQETKEMASAGETVGLMLKNINERDVLEAYLLVKEGTLVSSNKFDANVYIMTEEEGGRSTPFFSTYKPMFNFYGSDVSGSIVLPSSVEMVSPGSNVSFTATLSDNELIAVGVEFAIREGGRVIGTGMVTKIYK